VIGIAMFLAALLLLAAGFPVAFTFGGVAVLFGLYAEGLRIFSLVDERIYSIMTNVTLMAVPLFVYMGYVLERSGIAERMLEAMGSLFGRVRGGLAVSTVLVGMVLAASTGVVGASVVAMGLIALPVMLKYRYDKRLASGVICASGTLGQVIPPSIILIILGDVLQIPVGDLFRAAVLPGLLLVVLYILYVLVMSFARPAIAPAMPTSSAAKRIQYARAAKALLPALVLMVLVLGSIFAGIATPTESAAVGAVGAMVLALAEGKFRLRHAWGAALETAKLTAMVFTILVGATLFSLVFTYTGGDRVIEELAEGLPGNEWGFLLLAMLAIFLLGFFIDFVEIAYIFVPMLAPLLPKLGIDPLWFAILVAVNLQTSFLTPPFGFSLFYLRGVAPAGVTTRDIYRGVMPFIALQLLALALLMRFPSLLLLRPAL
jgi:tripartite ATP-independent transporter DctM subunit